MLKTDFFGADEAITSFSQDKNKWVATIIFTGASINEIELKRSTCYDRIVEHSRNIVKEYIN
jgi:3-methylornithine--L-lysine ligase